jgi:dienelactone hydrolase
MTMVAWVNAIAARADGDPATSRMATSVNTLNPLVLQSLSGERRPLQQLLWDAVNNRTQAANLRESRAWQQVTTRGEWEKFRDSRLAALRRSLGEIPRSRSDLRLRVTREFDGDGHRIQNCIFESRPGIWVTANLYFPKPRRKSMPAIIIAHSHHNPKTQHELQDIGVSWAKVGCLVLVPDMIGHGERRQHPFVDATSYPESFRVSRQDYYFRHNVALQLHVAGESLMGWMVADLMRCVDLLESQSGIDTNRIIVLGSVAGGGDPAGVTAALDPRIAAVAPFNFGGPQPDYAIPAAADRDFYWFGVPYWETTRCLRNGARDGFAHWLIASSVAPRRLFYSHEFGWDESRDPAWPRLRRVFAFYDRSQNLAVVTGRGHLKGQPPDNTHCNNIGPYHRQTLDAAIHKAFEVPMPDRGPQTRRPAPELECMSPQVAREVRPRFVHEVAGDLARHRKIAAMNRLKDLSRTAAADHLRESWSRHLGDITPLGDAMSHSHQVETVEGIRVERLSLRVENGIELPMLLLQTPIIEGRRRPVVVMVSQAGKQEFLKSRSEVVAQWLRAGFAVCLPDVRGTGETSLQSRAWRGSETSMSQAELMLGQPMLGSRLRDLRSVMGYLRRRPELAGDRLVLWGDSFAETNAPDRIVQVPLDAAKMPAIAEPLGGLLALMGALFEESVQAAYVGGGLAGYESLMNSPFVYVHHDAVVPGALSVGDLGDVAAAVAPRPLLVNGAVDGLNRRVTTELLSTAFNATRSGYRATQADAKLRLVANPVTGEEAVRWLVAAMGN